MLNDFHWIIQYHAWTSPSHHVSHSLAHIRFIAMDRTQTASGFPFAKRAVFKSFIGIFQQSLTLWTELLISLFLLAIKTDHQSDYLFFVLYPCHKKRSMSMFTPIWRVVPVVTGELKL